MHDPGGRPGFPGWKGRPRILGRCSSARVPELLAVIGSISAKRGRSRRLVIFGSLNARHMRFGGLLPKRSGRPLDLQLPSVDDVRDVRAAMAAITTAVNNGDVTAEEAAHLVRWFEAYAQIITTHDILVRLEALESEAKESGDDSSPSKKI